METITASQSEIAKGHLQQVLDFSRLIIHNIKQINLLDESYDVNFGFEIIQDSIEKLHQLCVTNWKDSILENSLHLIREGQPNYEICGLIHPSVHEAIDDLGRTIWQKWSYSAYESNVDCLIAATPLKDIVPFEILSQTKYRADEKTRLRYGPLKSQELILTLNHFRNQNQKFLSELNNQLFNTVQADFKMETAQLVYQKRSQTKEPDDGEHDLIPPYVVESDPAAIGGRPESPFTLIVVPWIKKNYPQSPKNWKVINKEAIKKFPEIVGQKSKFSDLQKKYGERIRYKNLTTRKTQKSPLKGVSRLDK